MGMAGKEYQGMVLGGKKGGKILFFSLDYMCRCRSDNPRQKAHAGNLR